jgi:serine protease inhibitor ecotin
MHLEGSTEWHVYKRIHEVLIYMGFLMACPNVKKVLKMAFGCLGGNMIAWKITNVI